MDIFCFLHLEEEYCENTEAGKHAEWAEGGQRGARPDPEGHEVCDGGDGDGHARVGHHGADTLHQRLGPLVLWKHQNSNW